MAQRPALVQVARRDFNSKPSLAASSQLWIGRPGPLNVAAGNHAVESVTTAPPFPKGGGVPMLNPLQNGAFAGRNRHRNGISRAYADRTRCTYRPPRRSLGPRRLPAVEQPDRIGNHGRQGNRRGRRFRQRDRDGAAHRRQHVAGDFRAGRARCSTGRNALGRAGASATRAGGRGEARVAGARPVRGAARRAAGARHLRPDRGGADPGARVRPGTRRRLSSIGTAAAG